MKLVLGLHQEYPKVVKLEVGLHHGCFEVMKLVMGLHHMSQGGEKREFEDGGISMWASLFES